MSATKVDPMRRPVDQAKVQEHQQRLTDRQNERLARLHEQLRQAELERADRGTFHLKERQRKRDPASQRIVGTLGTPFRFLFVPLRSVACC